MSRDPKPIHVFCVQGCCAGCQSCYGMSIGCHQEPCRCDLPCSCQWKDEDTDPKWRDGCKRHDTSRDQRRYPEFVDLDPEDGADLGPCPECGATGACGYDIEGRAMIHAVYSEDES